MFEKKNWDVGKELIDMKSIFFSICCLQLFKTFTKNCLLQIKCFWNVFIEFPVNIFKKFNIKKVVYLVQNSPQIFPKNKKLNEVFLLLFFSKKFLNNIFSCEGL